MGKVIRYVFILALLVNGSVAFSSYKESEESDKLILADKLSGKWKLLKCNATVCKGCEVLEFSGSTMTWSKKQNGETRYQLTFDSESTFSAKRAFAGNAKNSGRTFRVTDCSSVSLTIVDSEGNIRVFAKDLSDKMMTENAETVHFAMN